MLRIWKNRWIQIATGCMLLMLLSGCDLIMDPKLLMKSPELTSDNQTLKSVIDQNIPGGVLIRPRGSKDVSTIRTVDLNQDGTKEAVVFYETPNETVKIHGMILEEAKDTWTVKTVFDGEGDVLESLEFADLNHDGKLEIVAGYSREDQDIDKGLTIYRYVSASVEKIFEIPYTYFSVDDLNGDGLKDLTIVSFKKDQYNTVTTYQYDGTFKEMDKLQLESNINKYLNFVAGNVTSKQKGIILDASILTHSAYSILITMEQNKLVNVLKQDSMYKDYPLLSGDVNNDNILEVGQISLPKGWDSTTLADAPHFLDFYQWDGVKSLKMVMQQYLDNEGRFVFNFPPELKQDITIDPKSDLSKDIKFTRISTKQEVAEIKVFALAEWDHIKDDWQLLIRDNDKVIGYHTSYDMKVLKR
ncbi:hypothetical protein J2Z69_000848 [Paenibacillus shirakamiensis]|uniref:VCBS repeat-containing protein n=1 Tax=Paenibacillus shirakamiensis TaxID=1265935 RepID=A0ABS4JGY9_9BACL|nr:hypothetical protein [Paenibacillus shirakamiensis]